MPSKAGNCIHMSNTFRNIVFQIFIAVPLITTFVPAKILGKS